MGKLRNISGKEAAKAFKKAGWQPVGQVGSQHKELSIGTLRRLISNAGLTVDEFLNLL